jgi:hypothetical protein
MCQDCGVIDEPDLNASSSSGAPFQIGFNFFLGGESDRFFFYSLMRRRGRERGGMEREKEDSTDAGSLVLTGGGFEVVGSASLLSVADPEGVVLELGKLDASSFGDSISASKSGG